MHRVGGLLNWIGGGVTRMAGTGLAGGLFLVVFGMTPAEGVAFIWSSPPSWLMSGWTRLAVLILGLAIIAFFLNYNIWSRKQLAIDALAEDISDAIRDLVNRTPVPTTPSEIAQWEADYHVWINKVSRKLENRAFFTRADQLHFDRLGYITPITMNQPDLDWRHSQLKLKFERLRDVINWSQQRRH